MMLTEFQKRKFTVFFGELDENGTGHLELSDLSYQLVQVYVLNSHSLHIY